MFFKQNKGFTFIELLIAVMILAISIGGVLLLFTTSMISSQLAWDTTTATSHAEHVLEEMQTQDSIDQIRNFNWEGWSEVQGLNTLPGENIDIAFVNLRPNLLDVKVTVHWVRKSRKHDITLKTKFAK